MVLVLGMTPLLAICAEPAGGGDKPLLMEGKHELYQRVLAVPGARLAKEAGGQGPRGGSTFYRVLCLCTSHTRRHGVARGRHGSAWQPAPAGCRSPVRSNGTMG